ncbi:transcription regulator protein (Transcriptional regulator, LacI family) [Propionibacterium freudenreichii]|uniref:LacI family DNA-binding transcriptional regulator n=1 Tax=Propionibacterium freudenreichii TaxID=1744 RepID=UPI0005A5C7B7|nr:LacI family DNA-binding transcriptional regulator [Propionibacterium freudenreichii]MDK9675897.1 LacI family DNA-binding transcriptional regulator [Propionibacterium freudenreichii]CEI48044.1 transcription regulator protein (Transcriptional regulator, LacI family) [Propionibacterium freudenreichii]SCQ47676.1 Transcriptional regulator [Propionibacterium freudenreichii]SCQ55666.1 Transcriptional regulator [Propionibacterium freudenreichii]
MAGGSRPTQADVARLAGVSRQTVSLVVLDDPRVSPRSRAAVTSAMAQLNYRPNVAARALVSHHTEFLGIVFSDLANPFHAELAEALRAAADRLGFVPFISPVGQSADEEKVAINRFTEMAVDGLILVSPLSDNTTLEAVGAQVPTVIVTRNSGPANVDLVHADDRASAAQVTQHLLAAGYDPVVFLGYERRIEGDSSLARIDGYRAAMRRAARPEQVQIVTQGGVPQIVGGLAASLTRGFGLVCHNDLIALEAWAALAELGLEPGPDVGVAGFDDTGMARFPGVGLTSVNNGTTGFADTAVEMISQRLAGRTARREVVLPTHLIVRRSTLRDQPDRPPRPAQQR